MSEGLYSLPWKFNLNAKNALIALDLTSEVEPHLTYTSIFYFLFLYGGAIFGRVVCITLKLIGRGFNWNTWPPSMFTRKATAKPLKCKIM